MAYLVTCLDRLKYSLGKPLSTHKPSLWQTLGAAVPSWTGLAKHAVPPCMPARVPPWQRRCASHALPSFPVRDGEAGLQSPVGTARRLPRSFPPFPVVMARIPCFFIRRDKWSCTILYRLGLAMLIFQPGSSKKQNQTDPKIRFPSFPVFASSWERKMTLCYSITMVLVVVGGAKTTRNCVKTSLLLGSDGCGPAEPKIP